VTVSERTDDQATPSAVGLGPLLSRRFTTYGADTERSLFQLFTTGATFIALLTVMAWASHDHYWLTLLLALPAAGLLVRLFIIKHD
jgi:omega-6 fatty acid desaturase (delta-12 desaturase)